jgi:hypothetical protein
VIKFDYVTVVRATAKNRGEICGFLLWIVCLWADSIFGVKIGVSRAVRAHLSLN